MPRTTPLAPPSSAWVRTDRMSAPLRQIGLVLFATALFAAACLGTLYLGRDQPALLILPLALAVCIAAGVVLLFAICGSPAAQMSFLFVLVFVNDALFRVREPGDLALDWQNALKFSLWAGAFVIGAAQIGRSWRVFCTLDMTLLLSWLGIALLSCFYSASPSYSFGTAFGAIGMLLLSAGLTVTLTEKQTLLTFAISLCVFVLAGWVAYFAVPELGRSPFITADGSIIERMSGLTGQANALGCSLATLLCIVFLLWFRGHCGLATVLPMGALGMFTLLAADSRTALLAFLIAAAAVVARRSLWRLGAALLAFGLGSVFLAAVPLQTILGLTGGLARSGDPSEMLTLTGRTEIWAFCWDKIQLQPWFGYGYNSSKYILPLFLGLPGLTIDEAHNTWLQNLLGTGIIGTTPLLLLVIAQLVGYVQSPNGFRDLLMFLLLVWGITVAGAYGSTPTVMTLLALMSNTAPARPAYALQLRALPRAASG